MTGIGRAKAEGIFFLGFTGLNATATLCDARAATVTAAGAAEEQSTSDAWEAVGVVTDGCNGGGGGTTDGDGTVRGGVSADGANLKGATVLVEATGLTDDTNRGGKYKINNVPAATYDVTASADGFCSQTQAGVSVQAGATVTVGFDLTCAP